MLQGTKTWLLANDDGQIELTHSVSAGLDYAAIGPEHAYLQDIGRVEYTYATDEEALAAFKELAECEGIIPALESAHAMAYVSKIAGSLPKESIIIANLSGRGDKDVEQASIGTEVATVWTPDEESQGQESAKLQSLKFLRKPVVLQS